MAAVRVQVTIPYVGGGPADVSMNTLYLDSIDPTEAAMEPVRVALAGCYTGVKTLYSTDVNFAAANLKAYDLADEKPRVPFYEALLGTSGTGSAGLPGPQEIALCLSFYGIRAAGIPQSRRRGRIYLGPFGINTIGYANPQTNTLTTVASFGSSLVGASNGQAWNWVVYSPTTAADPLGGLFDTTPVIGGWVDNAWDTQRRRGLEPSARTTWGLTPLGG